MLHRTTSRIAFVAALLALGSALAEPAFAQRGRGGGGGMRAGGMRAGGGGGGMRAGGYSGSRGGGLRSSASTSMSRSSYNRPSGGYQRSAGGYQRPAGGVNRGQMAANRPAGGYDRSQIAANRPAGGYQRGGDRGAINSGNREINRDRVSGDNRVNRGDINVGNSSNINIDNDGGWGGWNDYPVGAGLAFGTAAAVTAAAWGSVFYSLPAGCSPYPYAGYSYYHCGGAYYEPRYEGDTVVYVTVPEPGSSGSSTTVTTTP